jgi:hypothetical protein
MNELQINYLLKTNKYTKDCFRGTFAADELKYLKPNSIYIVNLDTRYNDGSHWISISRNDQNQIFYFCTSGISPFELNIISMLKQYPIIYFSPENIQSLSSTSCGLYCVLITYLLSRKVSLRKAIDLFSNDHFCNDIILREKIKEYFYDELF